LANKSDFDDVNTIAFRNVGDTQNVLVVTQGGTGNTDRTSVVRTGCP